MTKGKPDEIDRMVGKRLQHFRGLRGFSQADLGKSVGITFQQIQKYERAYNRISASRLYKLSKALDVPIGDFFDGEGEHSEETSILNIPLRYMKLVAMLISIDNRDLERALLGLIRQYFRE